jgi:hypothetical protein
MMVLAYGEHYLKHDWGVGMITYKGEINHAFIAGLLVHRSLHRVYLGLYDQTLCAASWNFLASHRKMYPKLDLVSPAWVTADL